LGAIQTIKIGPKRGSNWSFTWPLVGDSRISIALEALRFLEGESNSTRMAQMGGNVLEGEVSCVSNCRTTPIARSMEGREEVEREMSNPSKEKVLPERVY